MADLEANRPTLGKLLKGLRHRNGWTLKAMSERSGIPVSTLSKIEHDRLTLSYDKLYELSRSLKIPIAELFAEPVPQPEATVTARRSIGLLENAVQVTTPNYDYHYMCPELRRKHMVPIVTKIRAKTVEQFGDLVRHPGEEYVYVLDGAIEVHSEFYGPVLLRAGESIYLDSNMGHAYIVAPGCTEATVLGICSGGEEDLIETMRQAHGTALHADAL